MDPLGVHDPGTIGPYRLRARLGAGGMGQVYLGAAEDGALVAIKVVHPGLAHDERFRARFRREIEVGRRVTGPWVAAVVDADPDAPAPWLATQYVRGPSLSTAVTELGPLDTSTVHVLAHGLAVALGDIHGAGLVHRDLKPSNVLLDPDHPRLIDFGISRAVDGTRMTSTGMVIGTPAFMSPEQISGTEVDAASDVFSLGSVLTYAATGRSPFGDPAPVVLMLRITRDEPDLDGVPDHLRAPIAACLAKRPEDRPTAAGLSRMLAPAAPAGNGWLPPAVAELAADVDAPTSPAASSRVEPGPPDHLTGRGANRRLVLAAVGAVGVAALVGGGVLAASALTATPPQPPGPPTGRIRWEAGFPSYVDAVAVDDRALYLYGRDNVVRALDAATGAERWAAPGWAGPPPTGDGAIILAAVGGALIVGTKTVVAALDTTTGSRIWEMPRSANVPSIAVSDGIVLAETADGVAALDLASGAQRWAEGWIGEPGREDGILPMRSLTASASRTYLHGLGTTTRDALDAVDLPTGRRLWRYEGDTAGGRALAADDAVYLADDKTLLSLDAATGRVRWQTPLNQSTAVFFGNGLVLAGNVLVVSDRRGDGNSIVRGLDSESGTERWSLPPDGQASPTGPITADQLVYVSAEDGSTSAYDVTTGAHRWSLPERPNALLAARGNDVYVDGATSVQSISGP